jgi:tetratricopeptide (TPR) repeat protein
MKRRLLFTLFFLLPLISWSQTTVRGGIGFSDTSPSGERNFKDLWVLVIGISEYNNSNVRNLNYADDDAKLFFTYLKTFYKNDLEKKEEIHYRRLIDEEATQSNINKELQWLRRSAKPNDLVVIYFAGHAGVEDDNEAYFYCHGIDKSNLSATAIPFSRVNNDLAFFTKNSVQAIFIADACHAGLMKQENYSFVNTALAETNKQPSNTHRLLSSKQNQYSIESPTLCNGHGYFTYFLIKGLLGEADGSDSNPAKKDGLITIHELDSYLQKDLYSATNERQVHQIITSDEKFIVGRQLKQIPADFKCLLEQGTSSEFAYAEVLTEQANMKNKLTKDQNQVYDAFVEALQRKDFLIPEINNAYALFQKLRQLNVPSQTLTLIQEEWKVEFSKYAQSLLQKYMANGKIPGYEEYQLGAELLKKYMEHSDNNDPNLSEIKAQYVFLTYFSLYRKYTQYALIEPNNQINQIYKQGINKIKAQLQESPNAAYLYNLLGRYYDVINDKERSQSAYQRASVLAKDWTYPQYNLIRLNKRISVKERLASLEKLQQKSPDFTDLYLEIARVYRIWPLNNFDQSLKFIQKAEQKAKDINEDNVHFARIYTAYGNHYWRQKDYKQAEAFYLKAIQTNSKYIDAYENLSSMCRQNQEFDKAKHYALEGLKKDQFNDGLLDEMGWINLDLKNNQESEEYFSKRLAYDTTSAYAHFSMAVVLRAFGKTEQANIYAKKGYSLAKALRDSSNMALCLTEIGYVFSVKLEFLNAEPYFEQAIQIDSTCSRAYYFSAYNYWNWTKYDKAFEYFTKYQNLGNDANENLGDIQVLQKKTKEAITYYRKALLDNPNNFSLYDKLATLYNQEDKRDSAFYFLEKTFFENAYYKKKDFQGLYDFYLNAIKKNEAKWAYYGIGTLWEKGVGRDKNIDEAIKWYMYAAQIIYWPAFIKLSTIYSKKSDVTNKENIQLFLNKVKTSSRFTIPAHKPDGSKIPVLIYINDYPLNEDNPIEGELNRIKEIYDATLPEDVVSAFKKLYDLAKKNKVSYKELCEYALKAANQEKNKEIVALYEKKIQEFNPITEADSVFANMERVILGRFNTITQKPLSDAYNMVIEGIKEKNETETFLYYYLMGYLYEKNNDNPKAIKWYTYAFQMGYKPAYVRLRQLHRFVSVSKVEWLEKNHERRKPVPFFIYANESSNKSERRTIYLMDYPTSFWNPIELEEERLKEVYGLTIPLPTRNMFAQIYQLAQRNKMSFQDLYAKMLIENEKKKLITEDQQLINEGIALFKKSDFTGAYRLFAKAIDVNTKNSRAYFYRGFTAKEQKDLEQSKKDLFRATELDEDNALYNETLGHVYTALKEYNEAKMVYHKAYELGNNKSSTLLYNLACIYSLEGRITKALKYLDEALQNGYRDFEHVSKNSDLANIRSTSLFNELIEKYSKK